MSNAEDAGCFTVTWKIENCSLLLGTAGLRSPAWKTCTDKESAWWRLRAFHLNSKVEFHLMKLTGSYVLDRCEMLIINSRGDEIPLEDNSSLTHSIEKKIVLSNNSNSIFPKDTLTLLCKMWKKTTKTGECHHHSVLHKLNYLWNNKNCNPCDPKFIFTEKNNILMHIYVKRQSEIGAHTVIVGSVPKRDSYVSFVDFNLFINDGHGLVINKESIYPYVSYKCEIENFTEEIQGGGLQFQVECIVAVHKDNVPHLLSSESSILDSSGILSNDLLQIYKEKTFSDAILTTEEKSFSAHRSILAARSPVFSAMFKKEQMSEGREGVVVIKDVDSATLGRMLAFLYSDYLQEMNWEETSALYYAADKYAVPYLKQKCADVLKAGLALDNACQVLILADTHSDQELMKCAIDFIRDHQEVVASAEWEQLEESNYKLAAKTLREVIVKK